MLLSQLNDWLARLGVHRFNNVLVSISLCLVLFLQVLIVRLQRLNLLLKLNKLLLQLCSLYFALQSFFLKFLVCLIQFFLQSELVLVMRLDKRLQFFLKGLLQGIYKSFLLCQALIWTLILPVQLRHHVVHICLTALNLTLKLVDEFFLLSFFLN